MDNKKQDEQEAKLKQLSQQNLPKNVLRSVEKKLVSLGKQVNK